MRSFWNKNRTKILAGGVVLIVVVLLIMASGRHTKNGFETFEVVRGTVTERVEVAGKVESNNFAELAFEVTGKVTAMNVSVGDTVSEGEVLARLSTSELQADLLDAEAQVDIKQANLANAETSLSDTEQQQNVIVEGARRKLLSTDLEATPEEESLASALTAPLITGNYKGPEGVYKIIIKPNDITPSQPELHVFGVETFIGEVDDVNSKPLGTYGLFIRLVDEESDYVNTIWYVDIPNQRSSNYTTNLAAYEQALEDRTVAITEARSSLSQEDRATSIALAELKQAQARVNKIRAQISQRILRAPFNGQIAAVEIEEGEIASSGSKAISIVSGGDFEITLEVAEIDVSKLEVGNLVSIELDAFGKRERWEGEILAISQAETYVDGVPVYETRVRFLEPDDRIRSGLSSTVSIVTEVREDVVTVPVEYIDRDELGSFVKILTSDEEVERRDVATGLRGSNGLVEIIEGLSLGEIITTKPLDQ